ncbi:MAG: putative lipoprotein [Myxococcaceae bacterium]|nr:putative lipoprotein [Myxococcaceae bacterium]
MKVRYRLPASARAVLGLGLLGAIGCQDDELGRVTQTSTSGAHDEAVADHSTPPSAQADAPAPAQAEVRSSFWAQPALPSAAKAAQMDAGPAQHAGATPDAPAHPGQPAAATVETFVLAQALLQEGRQTFRHDTFGDEDFWGGSLRLHEAIEGQAHGGVGDGVSPKVALSVGLKVDSEALPAELTRSIQQGKVDLDDPATTLALLKLGAVVGVKGVFADDGASLRSLGIQCALCHSTVDDSFAPGIGKRLDGWPNRDLNVGAIVGLSPDLSVVDKLLGVPDETVRKVLASWGPGKFDAALFLDGKAVRPDGKTGATLIPPAFGLAGVNLTTSTGWGSVTHWNAFVANLEMHGKGTFYDPRLDDADKFPIAAREGFGHVTHEQDLITPKLPGLQLYQLALRAPKPPPASYDAALAARGKLVFEGKARCASCHVAPLYSEPGYNMHTPEELGIDAFQAGRSPDGRYRTTPLAGLFTRTKGGFYHDGRFATLSDVIAHYNDHFALALQEGERTELLEFLKSL